MSVVSDIIIAFGFPIKWSEQAILSCISLCVYEDDNKEWFEPVIVIGGNKHLQVCMAIAAFNYLNHQDFINRIKRLPWKEWDCSFAQVMIQGEYNDGFGIVDIYRAEWSDPAWVYRP